MAQGGRQQALQRRGVGSAVVQLGRWWSAHRLRIPELSHPARAALVCTSVLAVGAMVVLATGGRTFGPGDVVGLRGQESPVIARTAFFTVTLALLGGFSCLAAARSRPSGRPSGPAVVAGGVVSALVGAEAVNTHRVLGEVGADVSGMTVLSVSGGAAVALGVLSAGIALAGSRYRRIGPGPSAILLAGVGAGPVAVTIAYGWTVLSIDDDVLRSATFELLLVRMALIASSALGVWVIWSVADEITGHGARAGAVVQRLATERTLHLLLVGKISYLVLAHEVWRPGGDAYWRGRAGLTWVHAALVASVAVIVVLLPRSRRIGGRSSRMGVRVLIAAIAVVNLCFLLVMGLLIAGDGAGLGDGWSTFWLESTDRVIEGYEELALATTVFAGVVATLGVRRDGGRLSPPVLLLGAFSLWGSAPALGTLLVSRGVDTLTFWAQPVQVDVAVTVAVAVLALLRRARWSRTAFALDVRALVALLLCSTVIVHLSLVLPSLWEGGAWNVLLVIPVVSTFVARDGDAERTSAEVLWLTGSWTLFLATAGYAVIFDTFDQVVAQRSEELATLWFAVPLAITAAFVATDSSRTTSSTEVEGGR